MAVIDVTAGRTEQASTDLPGANRTVTATITLDTATFQDPDFTLHVGFERWTGAEWLGVGPIMGFVGRPGVSAAPISVYFSSAGNGWIERDRIETLQGKTIRPFLQASRAFRADVTLSVA